VDKVRYAQSKAKRDLSRHKKNRDCVLQLAFPRLSKSKTFFVIPGEEPKIVFCAFVPRVIVTAGKVTYFFWNQAFGMLLAKRGAWFHFSCALRQTIKGGHTMKVLLRIYEHVETLEREFSSAEEVRRMTRELTEANPNLFIEPCLEVEAGRVIALSEV
jgi:hypothetical protein